MPFLLHKHGKLIDTILITMLVILTIMSGVGIFLNHNSLIINDSASLPSGIWQKVSDKKWGRGDIITYCLPENMSQPAKERHYLSFGDCSNQLKPLLKSIAALLHDNVTETKDGIAVNRTLISSTQPKYLDRSGKPLQPYILGSYIVPEQHIVLISNYSPYSYDSRYFGPVPVNNVRSIMRPIYTNKNFKN